MTDRNFWYFFGGIWLLVGLAFLGLSLGINVFAEGEIDAETPAWIFVLAGVALTGAGGAILYFARAAAQRDLRLMGEGVAATATVANIRRSNVRINRQERWHVRYQYEHPPGNKREGESRGMPGEQVMGLRPGDPIEIRIDPRQPEQSLYLGPQAPGDSHRPA